MRKLKISLDTINRVYIFEENLENCKLNIKSNNGKIIPCLIHCIYLLIQNNCDIAFRGKKEIEIVKKIFLGKTL